MDYILIVIAPIGGPIDHMKLKKGPLKPSEDASEEENISTFWAEKKAQTLFFKFPKKACIVVDKCVHSWQLQGLAEVCRESEVGDRSIGAKVVGASFLSNLSGSLTHLPCNTLHIVGN